MHSIAFPGCSRPNAAIALSDLGPRQSSSIILQQVHTKICTNFLCIVSHNVCDCVKVVLVKLGLTVCLGVIIKMIGVTTLGILSICKSEACFEYILIQFVKNSVSDFGLAT